MVRPALALLAAVSAGACHSYSSGPAVADVVAIGVGSASEVALNDCELPRSSFHPTGAPGAGLGVPAGARFTVVALHRGNPPLRPHRLIGTVRVRVGGDSCSNADLVEDIRGRATAEGCDAVVLDHPRATPSGGARLDGSCLVFAP